MSATALWFGPEHRRRFGWLHLPEGVEAAPAVVLCPPLGRELIKAHYPFRLLAQMLEDAGLIVVRFDYDGTGDSVGDAHDPQRIESWTRSIDDAAALARAQGASSISLVGLRMGSLLAEVAAPQIADLHAMVLWDPCVTGKAFVRHQRALELLRIQNNRDGEPYDGAPGGLIDAGTLELLKTLDAPEHSPQDAPATLVLHRPEEFAIDKLLARLAGRRLDVEPVEGQAAMLDVDAIPDTVPTATLNRISEWLSEQLIFGTAVPQPARTGRPELWSASTQMAVVARAGNGNEIRERIVKLGEFGLFGIETFSVTAAAALPTIVFLNSGKDWHGGPIRLWVRLARSYAKLGFRCVRFDMSGLGDSPVRPGRKRQVVRAPEAFEDLTDALTTISPDDPSNVILVGLCSGGYQALESGITIKPRAILTVNPQLAFTPPETQGAPIDRRRRICLATSPTRVSMYRRIVSPSVRTFMRPLVWRVRRLFASEPREPEWITELVDSGTDIVCVCGKHDSHQLPTSMRKTVPASGDGGSLQFELIEALNHGLVHPGDQDQVFEIFSDYLTERFKPGQPNDAGRATELPSDQPSTTVLVG